jgi:ubiquitin carboxyl-terminal hydrolase 4/11/15
MLSGQWLHDRNTSNPLGMKGELVTAFAKLCEDVWCGSASSVQPTELKRVIGRFAPQFSGWNQQDSHELLTFLLDGIHEDLNRVHKKPTWTEGIYGNGTDDELRANESWERHFARNNSPVVDIFHGQYRSRLLCPKCSQVTTVFDPFLSVALPIARQNSVTASVKFTPYEFSEPIQHLTVSVNAPSIRQATVTQVRDAIVHELGRDMEVIVQPRQSQCGCMDDLIVYEIPDQSTRYVTATVKLYRKPGATGYFSDATHYFLLQISGVNISYEDIERECEQRLESIWGEEEPVSMKLPLMDPLPASIVFEPDQRLMACIYKSNSVSERGLRNVVGFANKKTESLLFDNHVVVFLNSAFPFSRARLAVNWRSHAAPASAQPSAKPDGVSLHSCFSYHAEPETLDEQNQWYCPRCEQFCCAEKKVDIWRMPEILVIQLKRYVSGQYQIRKLDTTVDFPDILDVREFVAGPQHVDHLTYRLYAVSNHMGSMSGGHYTAHAVVQDPRADPERPPRWYSFNDSSVSPVSPRAWKGPAAYLLFYERIAPNEKDGDRPAADEEEDV